jgi:hypothetical protein
MLSNVVYWYWYCYCSEDFSRILILPASIHVHELGIPGGKTIPPLDFSPMSL